MNLLLGILLLDKVFGEGDLTENILSTILLFIGMILYLFTIWKAVGYIEKNLIEYLPVFAACFFGLTYMIPRFKDKSSFIRSLIFKLLILINIGVCFILFFVITHLLGDGIATFIANYTLVPISEVLVTLPFPFTLLGGALRVITSLITITLDFIIFPFTIFPLTQRIVWSIMSVDL